MEAITFYYHQKVTNPFLREFISRLNDLRYRYYASELLEELVHDPDFEPEQAVRKAIAVCKLTGIPVQEHFTPLFRCDPNGLSHDWKLSDLACGIILVSFDANNESSRNIQNAFIRYLGL